MFIPLIPLLLCSSPFHLPKSRRQHSPRHRIASKQTQRRRSPVPPPSPPPPRHEATTIERHSGASAALRPWQSLPPRLWRRELGLLYWIGTAAAIWIRAAAAEQGHRCCRERSFHTFLSPRQ